MFRREDRGIFFDGDFPETHPANLTVEFQEKSDKNSFLPR